VIEVVDKDIIRRLHHVQGWSERRIARELGFARDTVRKYLRDESDTVPRYCLTKRRAKPVIDEVLPLLRQWLADDALQPPKQRRTAHRMWRQLCDDHAFTGAESTVRQIVRDLKGETRPVFVPLAFDPGERAEVDWGTAQVILNGVVTTAHLFCARLRYSGMPFVMAFPHEQQEAFFEGHRRAFEHWGGVPKRVVYDNLTTAVQQVLAGHGRVEQQAFVTLRMHYLYEAVFCNVASGHEKGSVESLVGTIRRRYLAPMPTVSSWTELNDYLWTCCHREATETRPGLSASVGERWTEERTHLLPLPARPFEAARRVTVTASKMSEVRFATNRYSVPVAYAYQPLVLKADVDTVRIYQQTTLIAEHRRCYGRHQTVSDWRHYLPLFAKKPGAVPFAAALRTGELAPVFERFREGLCARQTDGNRAFVRVLELCVEHPVALVTQAVTEVVTRGAFQVEAVEQVLERWLRPVAVAVPLDPERYPEYATLQLAPVSLAGYDRLLPSHSTAAAATVEVVS
jgi:transposase